MTRPTWKQAITIMKQLQLEYGLPIFAATYQGSCSCCAEVSDINDEAYLSSTVKNLDWDDIDSYLIFSNAHNRGGEANLNGEFGDVFGDSFIRPGDGYYFVEKIHRKKQYVFHHTNDTFTLDQVNECLRRFVDKLNELSDTHSLEPREVWNNSSKEQTQNVVQDDKIYNCNTTTIDTHRRCTICTLHKKNPTPSLF